MAERGDIEQYLAEGRRLIASRLYDRAMIEFNKALKLDSKTTVISLNRLLDMAEETGDYEGAIAVGTNMLLNQPDMNVLANKLGNAYRKTKNFGQAIKLYKHCLKHSPKDRFASYNLAATMARSDLYDGDVVGAVLLFEKVDGPKLPTNQLGTQRLLKLQKELQAEEESQTTTESDQPTETEQNFKNRASQKNQLVPEELFNHLCQNKSIAPEEQQTLLKDLSIYCLEHNDPKIAWRALTHLIFKVPKDTNLQIFLALAYAARGEEQVAIDKLLSLLGYDPYNRYANVNLGYLYKNQGKTLLSRKYFIITYQLLEKSQNFYDMHLFKMKGEQYFEEEVYKNALKVFEVLREEQENSFVLFRLGQIYLELEDYGNALEVYQRLVSTYREEPEVENYLNETNQYILQIANSLMGNHRYSSAVLLYEMSLVIVKTKQVIENALSAYKLLRDEENEKRLETALKILEKEERDKEIEDFRLEKLQEAQKLEARNSLHKAIQAYEAALRMKPEEDTLLRLTALYKRIRQPDMIQDVKRRYKKAVERMQRLAELEAEEQPSNS